MRSYFGDTTLECDFSRLRRGNKCAYLKLFGDCPNHDREICSSLSFSPL